MHGAVQALQCLPSQKKWQLESRANAATDGYIASRCVELFVEPRVEPKGNEHEEHMLTLSQCAKDASALKQACKC